MIGLDYLLNKFAIVASAGPLESVLKDSRGRMKSFAEVMYPLYSSDARGFVANQLKQAMNNTAIYANLSPELQVKARGILVLELVATFCQSAEDLAAFGISFATELYRDSLSQIEVWAKLANYGEGEIVDFYAHTNKRGPEYFANLHGYPPLNLQKVDSRRTLLRSCRQLAAYFNSTADAYLKLRDLYNAYKHGMRIFFATLNPETPIIIYIGRDSNVNSIAFPKVLVVELFALCEGIGQLLNGMLKWHWFRLQVAKSGNKLANNMPVFGESGDDEVHDLGRLMFPNLADLRAHFVSQGDKIAAKSRKELSRIRRGEIIAVDIDLEDILPCHSYQLNEVIWEAMRLRPGARLVFRRVSKDGKVGAY